MHEFPVIGPAIPEIFLAVMGMALMMVGVFSKDSRAYPLVNGLALAALFATLVLVMRMAGTEQGVAFNGLFIVDDFAVFMKSLVLVGTLVTLIMSRSYLEHERMARFEFPVLIVFASVGMMMMVSANDLIALYLGLELQSLSLYVVAAFHRDSIRSTEAGLKYFVLGALSSGMLLYGASMIYGFTGSTNFDVLARHLGEIDQASIGLVIGMVFLMTGFAFKISAVPFHMWTPDVYEGSPTPVTAFFAVAPKVAAIALMMRVLLDPFAPLVAEWRQIIVFISILSMILGALAAIGQTNIKRLMAYSSIGHIGYALVGLAAGTENGVAGVVIYMTIYMIMNVGTFACILSMQRGGRMVEGIADLAGLGRTNPKMALAMLIFMFSMAGVPPMAGFFGKLYVFYAAINAELYTLAVVGMLTSVIGAFYYLRIVKVMYFDEALEGFERPASLGISSVMAVSAAITVGFILWPSLLVETAGLAAAALVGG